MFFANHLQQFQALWGEYAAHRLKAHEIRPANRGFWGMPILDRFKRLRKFSQPLFHALYSDGHVFNFQECSSSRFSVLAMLLWPQWRHPLKRISGVLIEQLSYGVL